MIIIWSDSTVDCSELFHQTCCSGGDGSVVDVCMRSLSSPLCFLLFSYISLSNAFIQPNTVIRVIVVNDPPFVQMKSSPDGSIEYSGLCIDIIHKILENYQDDNGNHT